MSKLVVIGVIWETHVLLAKTILRSINLFIGQLVCALTFFYFYVALVRVIAFVLNLIWLQYSYTVSFCVNKWVLDRLSIHHKSQCRSISVRYSILWENTPSEALHNITNLPFGVHPAHNSTKVFKILYENLLMPVTPVTTGFRRNVWYSSAAVYLCKIKL